ncbi:3-deoxy-D-manno-octulosonic acid transferase [Methylocystis parvus]|uniref:3-deoxy-D-manno-octulosonic acid transferase n=1 Tax=Methylocystis parvus TaxID=134 RepID=A0A6B8M784_9HYPH|nr:3-deoxy-D-manno-octulosonic acid transferase [Methylocystis parvus]QGM98225.1 3-deoxy-D-manno-octulosonic acid transferase [Methylocystis parvus]WBK01447.1 3-deoxy-D-manno-octulosonic acid transferase [Methylocystis parvus OBBP]
MPLLTLYRLATIAATPFAGAALHWRASEGKEDPARLDERMGVASRERPEGRLVWLHGASLGETVSLLPLIDRFIQRGAEVLVTSGTVSSARLLQARLPAGSFHQYMPLDAPKFVDRFLDYWRPDIAIFAESELWPNMVSAVRARGVALVLANARISRKSAERWSSAPGVARAVFGMIDLCLAQDSENAARFLALGAPCVRIAGNLKFDVPPPPVDAARLAEFNGALGNRPVWAAVSTHAGEEEIILDVHAELVRQIPNLLTVIAPRHRERGAEIAALAEAKGLPALLRTRDGEPRRDSGVYVADTIGELGLLFRSVGVVFMGKSLVPGGGQNPIEPAKLGCAVLYGPHVENFNEVYGELAAAKAAARVADGAALTRAVQYLLAEPARMRRMGRAGAETVEKLGGASRGIMTAVEPFLAQIAAAER